jgi:tetratricopeptide (TPR) repeat protein
MPPRLFLLAMFLLSLPAFSSTATSVEEIAKKAEQAQNANQLNQAIGLYRQGVRLQPSWSQGWWALGTLLYDQDRFPEAKVAFRHFVSAAEKPGPGFAFLGLCEYETRDYDQALKHFRAWSSRGWSGTMELIDVSTFHFASLLTREGKFVEALYLLAGEAEKSHSGPLLIEAMGLASLRMRAVPEEYPAEQREIVWLAGKSAFYAASHPPAFQQAEAYANRLMQHYDDSPNVHYLVGTLWKFEDKNQDAAQEFRKELQISPKHAPAMIELARLELDDNRIEDAATLAKSACTIEPENSEAHRVYGQVLLNEKKYEESARELETAKRLAPDSAPIRFQLATVYRRLGRSQEAKRESEAFDLLKDKQMVIASPEEKLGKNPNLLK